ncbi:hypothetical protein [Rothia nasimurium]|nr:hypothetical protein [Rothia nasimurium]
MGFLVGVIGPSPAGDRAPDVVPTYFTQLSPAPALDDGKVPRGGVLPP